MPRSWETKPPNARCKTGKMWLMMPINKHRRLPRRLKRFNRIREEFNRHPGALAHRSKIRPLLFYAKGIARLLLDSGLLAPPYFTATTT